MDILRLYVVLVVVAVVWFYLHDEIKVFGFRYPHYRNLLITFSMSDQIYLLHTTEISSIGEDIYFKVAVLLGLIVNEITNLYSTTLRKTHRKNCKAECMNHDQTECGLWKRGKEKLGSSFYKLLGNLFHAGPLASYIMHWIRSMLNC